MAKIIQFDECGGSEKLALMDVTIPQPVGSEVRVSVRAFALNQADFLYLRGEHTTPTVLPSRICSEASGVVDAVGPDVKAVKVGDKVSTIPFQTSKYGVAGEYALVPEQFVAAVPSGLDFIQATSIWMQYLTAYFPFVEIAGVQPGDFALICAGASSAGIAAIQLAGMKGVRCIATTRSPDKRQFLYDIGAYGVIVTSEDDMPSLLKEMVGDQGIAVSYDPIGGRYINMYAPLMAKHSYLFHYGALSDDADELPMLDLLRRAVALYPYSMFNYVEEPARLEAGVSFVREGLLEGHLKPEIDKIFPFAETIKAFEYMAAGRQRGKIVVSLQ